MGFLPGEQRELSDPSPVPVLLAEALGGGGDRLGCHLPGRSGVAFGLRLHSTYEVTGLLSG